MFLFFVIFFCCWHHSFVFVCGVCVFKSYFIKTDEELFRWKQIPTCNIQTSNYSVNAVFFSHLSRVFFFVLKCVCVFQKRKKNTYNLFTISKQLNFISLKNESERKLKIYWKEKKLYFFFSYSWKMNELLLNLNLYEKKWKKKGQLIIENEKKILNYSNMRQNQLRSKI